MNPVCLLCGHKSRMYEGKRPHHKCDDV